MFGLQRKFYVRTHPSPLWAQDQRTLILIGRSTHLFNTYLHEWIRVAERPHPGALQRQDTRLDRMGARQWLRELGRHGWWELAYDMTRWRFFRRRADRYVAHRWPPMPEELIALEPPRIFSGAKEDYEELANHGLRENAEELAEPDRQGKPADGGGQGHSVPTH